MRTGAFLLLALEYALMTVCSVVVHLLGQDIINSDNEVFGVLQLLRGVSDRLVGSVKLWFIVIPH